jgi:nucleoid-associated protein YgaU
MKKMLWAGLLALVMAVMAHADVLALKQGYPQTYVVKKGDTLWDISNMFLSDPWRWPQLWHVNPQIQNPHLIYPGDTLNLVPIRASERGRSPSI